MEPIKLSFVVDGDDFVSAGEASASTKTTLKKLGFPTKVVQRVAIAMYEAEINMVIHAQGGTVDVEITPEKICVIMADRGPGIEDIDLAMTEGYSTAPDDVRSLGFGAGMGLPNIKKYSDNLEIETKLGVGTTLKITINC